jgi:hypothetical protein
MSILTCTLCSAYSSTDDGTGVFEDTGTGYWCEECVQNAQENPAENERIMSALKVQDFEAWRESISLHEGTPE